METKKTKTIKRGSGKKSVNYNAPTMDFKCSCGCGQKIRIIYLVWKNGVALDIGWMKHREKRPKVGVVLRSDEKDSYKEFMKFLKNKPKINLREI